MHVRIQLQVELAALVRRGRVGGVETEEVWREKWPFWGVLPHATPFLKKKNGFGGLPFHTILPFSLGLSL